MSKSQRSSGTFITLWVLFVVVGSMLALLIGPAVSLVWQVSIILNTWLLFR